MLLRAVYVIMNVTCLRRFSFHFQKEFFLRGGFSSTTEEKKLNVDSFIDDINYQYKLLKQSSASALFELEITKSDVRAIEFRNLGNDKFRKANDFEALYLYTISVAFARDESEEKALAYANRSAVLFRIREYESCLLDVNRALSGKYPEYLRKKLRDRKEQCLNEIRLEDTTNQQSRRINVDDTDPGAKVTSADEEEEWRSLCNFNNPLLPNASSKIKLKCDEVWGRYVTATEDIEPGN